MSMKGLSSDGATLQMRQGFMAIILLAAFLVVALIFNTPVTSFLLAILIASMLGSRRTGFFTLGLSSVLFWIFFRQENLWLTPHQSPYWKLAFLVCVGITLPELGAIILRLERGRVKSATDFKTLLEFCPDAILLLDPQMHIVGANGAALSLFGFEEVELVGSHVTHILPSSQFEEPFTADLEGRTKSNDLIFVSANWAQLDDRTMLFLRDVTNQRRIQAELQANEENLRLLVDTIPGLVYVRDSSGSIEQVSSRVSEYNGLSLDDLKQSNGFMAIHPEDRLRVESLIRYHAPLKLPFTYEFRHRRFDGSYRRFHASIQPLKDSRDNVVRWYTLLTDVEDQRSMEGALRDMQSELAKAARMATVTEITASVVHEISQPLSAAISTSQACLRLLQAENVDKNAVRSAVERVLHNTRDASQTVKNMRALFQRRAGGNDAVDIKAVIDDVLLLLASQIQAQGVRVDLQIVPALPFVAADRLQVQQVMMNLVSNAIESMEGNGDSYRELRIHVAEDEEGIVTEVADRGHGLSDAGNIFDAFYTTKATGMGMGLKISKTIVDAHQGRIWALPREGRGTSFYVMLPRAGKATAGSETVTV